MLSHVQLFVTPWTTRLLCPCGFSRQEHCTGLPFPLPGDLPNLGIKPRSPKLQVDSLPSELPGKPKNTGVSSWSLLEGIFPTQKLNRGLLHCRQIIYQLNQQGNPYIIVVICYFLSDKQPLFWYQTLFSFFSFWEQLFSVGLTPPCPCSAQFMVLWPMSGHHGASDQERSCIPGRSLRVGSGLFLVCLLLQGC